MAESLSSLSAINGKRFGQLTAVGSCPPTITRFGQRLRRWRFRCTCGVELDHLLAPVRRGDVRDCGCVAREAEKRARRPDEDHLRFKPDYEKDLRAFEREFGLIEIEPVTVNMAHTVFDKWLNEDEEFFQRRHVRVVGHARDLWRCVSSPSSHYLEFGGAGCRGLEMTHEDEMSARAMNLLRRARGLTLRGQWDVFENVVRWNEPFGFSGSRLCRESPRRGAETKAIVRNVAETVARSLFL